MTQNYVFLLLGIWGSQCEPKLLGRNTPHTDLSAKPINWLEPQGLWRGGNAQVQCLVSTCLGLSLASLVVTLCPSMPDLVTNR